MDEAEYIMKVCEAPARPPDTPAPSMQRRQYSRREAGSGEAHALPATCSNGQARAPGHRARAVARRPFTSDAQATARTTSAPAPEPTPAPAFAAGSAANRVLHLHSATSAAAFRAPARAEHAAECKHARPDQNTAHSSTGNRSHEHPIHGNRWWRRRRRRRRGRSRRNG